MVVIVGIVGGSIGACAVASWSSLGQIADNTFPETRFNALKSGTSINLPAEEQFESFSLEQSQLPLWEYFLLNYYRFCFVCCLDSVVGTRISLKGS